MRTHPGGAWYRLRKLTARHRLATISIAATVLALLIGTASLVVGLQAARNAERERAREAEVSRQVSDFLAGLFQSPDPLQSGGQDLSARDILDRGANQLRADTDVDPQVRGRLLQVIGDTYVGLGLGDEAVPLLNEASQILRQSPDDRLALATTLRLRAMIALDAADPATARPLLEEARQLMEDTADESDFEWVPLFTDMARLVSQEGDYEAAIPWRELALDRVETFHPQAPTVARIRSNLAASYLRLGQYDLAVPLLEQEIARWRAGEIEDAEVVDVLQVLGTTYGRTGRLDDGLDMLSSGIEIERRIYGNESPGLGSMLYARGLLLESAGRYDDARRVLSEALSLMEARGQENHPTTLFALQTLGRTSFKQGQVTRGREELARALEVATSLRSQPFFSPLRVLQVVAEMELSIGSSELAEEAVRTGLSLGEHWLEYDRVGKGLLLIEQAILAVDRGDPNQARQSLTEAEPCLADAGRERTLVVRRRALLELLRGDRDAMRQALRELRDLGYRDAWLARERHWSQLLADSTDRRLISALVPDLLPGPVEEL